MLFCGCAQEKVILELNINTLKIVSLGAEDWHAVVCYIAEHAECYRKILVVKQMHAAEIQILVRPIFRGVRESGPTRVMACLTPDRAAETRTGDMKTPAIEDRMITYEQACRPSQFSRVRAKGQKALT